MKHYMQNIFQLAADIQQLLWKLQLKENYLLNTKTVNMSKPDRNELILHLPKLQMKIGIRRRRTKKNYTKAYQWKIQLQQ